VVLGAGYAGAWAVVSLQEHLPDHADLTWVAENDYHFVLHEAHRLIRNPRAKDRLTVPVDTLKDHHTAFVEGEVNDVDLDRQVVGLAASSSIEYDYVLVAIGSETATYGITGIAKTALTLKSRADVLDVHAQLQRVTEDATHEKPATVVIGGAGFPEFSPPVRVPSSATNTTEPSM
jgi:NADH dehydrogenase